MRTRGNGLGAFSGLFAPYWRSDARGVATGVWNDLDELKPDGYKDVEWAPSLEASVRDREYRNWRKAVEKSFGRHKDGAN